MSIESLNKEIENAKNFDNLNVEDLKLFLIDRDTELISMKNNFEIIKTKINALNTILTLTKSAYKSLEEDYGKEIVKKLININDNFIKMVESISKDLEKDGK